MKLIILAIMASGLICPANSIEWSDIEKMGSDESYIALYTAENAPISGLLLFNIAKGSMADKSGIEDGDILVKIDGKNVPNKLTLAKKMPWNNNELEIFSHGKIKKVKTGNGLMGFMYCDYHNWKASYTPVLSKEETLLNVSFLSVILEDPFMAGQIVHKFGTAAGMRREFIEDMNALVDLRMCRHGEIPQTILERNLKARPALFAAGLKNSYYCMAEYQKAIDLDAKYPSYNNHNSLTNVNDIGIFELKNYGIEGARKFIDGLSVSKEFKAIENNGEFSPADKTALASGGLVNFSAPTAQYYSQGFGPGWESLYVTAETKVSFTDSEDSEYAKCIQIGIVDDGDSDNVISASFAHNHYVQMSWKHDIFGFIGNEFDFTGKKWNKIGFALGRNQYAIKLNDKVICCGYLNVMSGGKLRFFIKFVGISGGIKNVKVFGKNR